MSPHKFSQYGELRPTSGWDLLASLGHPSKFQWVLHVGSITARHSSIGRQSNFAALNRGHHLYSAGRPSRWALAHISSFCAVQNNVVVDPFRLLSTAVLQTMFNCASYNDSRADAEATHWVPDSNLVTGRRINHHAHHHCISWHHVMAADASVLTTKQAGGIAVLTTWWYLMLPASVLNRELRSLRLQQHYSHKPW